MLEGTFGGALLLLSVNRDRKAVTLNQNS